MDCYSKVLIRFSALFALPGAFLGSHIAGSDKFEFLSVHVHLLIVGWLSLFAFAVYYKVFKPVPNVVATLQVWSAIIGSIGLTAGMWFRHIGPFGIDTTSSFALIFFIVGGTILLISFLLFAILTFMKTEES